MRKHGWLDKLWNFDGFWLLSFMSVCFYFVKSLSNTNHFSLYQAYAHAVPSAVDSSTFRSLWLLLCVHILCVRRRLYGCFFNK